MFVRRFRFTSFGAEPDQNAVRNAVLRDGPGAILRNSEILNGFNELPIQRHHLVAIHRRRLEHRRRSIGEAATASTRRSVWPPQSGTINF